MWQGKKLSIIQLNKTQYIYGANNRHFMSSADEGFDAATRYITLCIKQLHIFFD